MIPNIAPCCKAKNYSFVAVVGWGTNEINQFKTELLKRKRVGEASKTNLERLSYYYDFQGNFTLHVFRWSSRHHCLENKLRKKRIYIIKYQSCIKYISKSHIKSRRGKFFLYLIYVGKSLDWLRKDEWYELEVRKWGVPWLSTIQSQKAQQ